MVMARCLTLIFYALCIARGSFAIRSQKELSVLGYLPEWRYEGANFDYILKTVTHLVLFSLEPMANGDITALDRIPRDILFQEARQASEKHGAKVLICFGGNGRSNGFSKMVRNPIAREHFIRNLVNISKHFGFDGVDYNWEYPGYSFGKGYHSNDQVELDYKGLALLVKETRKAFSKDLPGNVITMAYYPDGRQELLLIKHGISESVDLLNIMAYDQSGVEGHSTLDFGLQCLLQAIDLGLPASKLMLGLPFYGRFVGEGEWMSYEDIAPLDLTGDLASMGRRTLSLNSIETITKKTLFAIEKAVAGVMIWEVGQDCRVREVVHKDGSSHAVTCPRGEEDSLLHAISSTISKHVDSHRNHQEL